MIVQRIRQRIDLKKQAVQAARRKRLAGPHAVAIVCETKGGLFAVDPEDLGVGGQLLERGDYGAEELEVLEPFLKPESKVLIVGSHVGSLAIPIARRVKEIYAIEANPKTFRLLVMNLALNKITNARVAQIAASDKREQLSFLLSRANSGGSKRAPVVRDVYYYDRPETIQVEAHPLDEYLNETFDAIIMDIEGSEVFALRGMPKILARASALQVEFLPHHLAKVSGVSVKDFLAPIEPHFNRLLIPSRKLTVEKPGFLETLQKMYDREEADNGIIFLKA
jgi:FkbM family methyltransferase